MNNRQRKEIEQIINELTDIRAHIDCIIEDENEKYNNLPESLQDSERGEAMQDALDQLTYASDNVGDAIDNLNELVE